MSACVTTELQSQSSRPLPPRSIRSGGSVVRTSVITTYHFCSQKHDRFAADPEKYSRSPGHGPIRAQRRMKPSLHHAHPPAAPDHGAGAKGHPHTCPMHPRDRPRWPGSCPICAWRWSDGGHGRRRAESRAVDMQRRLGYPPACRRPARLRHGRPRLDRPAAVPDAGPGSIPAAALATPVVLWGDGPSSFAAPRRSPRAI